MSVTAGNLGIVVPTRNREKNVSALLASIENSTVHPAVCVLVDSSDYTYSIPSCSFRVVFEAPGVRGQVKQRNHGISLLGALQTVEYVLVLDDDIVLEQSAIEEALTGIARYVSHDRMFVGFAMNITNFRRSTHVVRRLLLHPRQPGKVTRYTANSSLANLDRDVECDWVIGGAALWNLRFLLENPSDYPFSGKAFSEDLYYCSLLRDRARFAALAGAKCKHVDHYEMRAAAAAHRMAYRAGVSDTNIRVAIAQRFPQYSVPTTILHIIWVGFAGILTGLLTFDRVALMLGFGRVTGLLVSEAKAAA